MKVVFINAIGDLSTTTGFGTYRWAYELYRGLLAIGHLQHTIDLSATDYAKFPYLLGGLSPLIYSLVDPRLENYDIVHSIDYRPVSKRHIKGVSVANVADFLPLCHPELINQSDKHGLKNRMGFSIVIKGGLKRQLDNDYIITCSEQSRQEAIDLGMGKDRIFVTPLGVDARFRLPIRRERNEHFTVGYVGSFTTRKNVIAFDRVMSKLTDADVVGRLFGSPSGYECASVVACMPRNTSYMGFASEKELPKIYRSFDVMLMPSTYEGFGLPILEALAAGTPVLLFKSALIPEEVKRHCIIADGEDEMAERIRDMATNGIDERARHAEMEYARSFTWQKTAELTMAAYEKMIQ